MDERDKNSPCKECDGSDGQLQAEVEHLRQHLAERDGHIAALEGDLLRFGVRSSDLEEQVDTWREKYDRLYDSHKRVQKLNQVLEDKLLQMVDKMKGEKSQLTKDIATLSVRLAESKHNYSMLQKENERYKNDMNLAIQLLQCKPDNFVAQKLDNLSVDTQARVSQYVMSKASKPSSSVQSKNGNEIETFDSSEYEFNISASLMTKILEDSIQDSVTKHCDTCTCSKSQNKPFCYNDSYYTVATQTLHSGELKSSLCIHCNGEIKSLSNVSVRSNSPHDVKLMKDNSFGLTAPMYIIPRPEAQEEKSSKITNSAPESIQPDEIKLEMNIQRDVVAKVEEEMRSRRKNSMNMEPAVHHKLCDRTKTSTSSKKSDHSIANDDVKEKEKVRSETENVSLRKNSQSSMGALSRTSSLAKSTVSTHKSNTQVGPGPRFCHLRMQAGSKNILLDNAEPDVPPVLYRRQSKCTENSIFKDLNDGIDNFIELDHSRKIDDVEKVRDAKDESTVVETTLVDVHVDNNNKEAIATVKTAPINPVLLNVSSSPLQPLKTHNFSNSSEQNNNHSVSSQQNATDIENLLSSFKTDLNHVEKGPQGNGEVKKHPETPTNSHEIKIFNFDRYEEGKFGSQYKPFRKIDMSQFHTLENTKISKDLPPHALKLDKKDVSNLPAIINVYPNLTQTHLKVNENKKDFNNEQSTSSLSSDDSAALLQKQQLLRVAEWVEQNLELQNSLNDPLEDEVNFNKIRRDSKISRLTETLNELALNMPHPVSKYSKTFKDGQNNWVHKNHTDDKKKQPANVAKETMFPVGSGDAVTEVNANVQREFDLKDMPDFKDDKEISQEDLARMEYNVKKFLLSGAYWANPGSVGRSRRTSSKTETDV